MQDLFADQGKWLLVQSLQKPKQLPSCKLLVSKKSDTGNHRQGVLKGVIFQTQALEACGICGMRCGMHW